MKLEKKHQEILQEIIESYTSIHKALEKKKIEMELLQNSIKSLLIKLEENRQKEKEFGLELEKYYGKGKFNIITGEYEIDN